MNIRNLIPNAAFENKDFEYKLKLDDHKEHVLGWLKSFPAFANTEGGTLFVGCDDEGNLAGLTHGEVDACKNAIDLWMDRMVRPSVEWTPHPIPIPDRPERYLLEIEIPEGKSAVILKDGDHSETIYVRHDGESVPATYAEIISLASSRGSTRMDSQKTKQKASLSDFTKMALAFKAYQKKRGLDPVPLTLDILQGQNGMTEDGFLTVAGLKFTDSYSGEDTLVDCRMYSGFDKGDSPVLDQKAFHGCIIDCVNFVMDWLSWRIPKGYEKTEEISNTPLVSYYSGSLREAVVNAFAHRDYAIDGTQINVDLYPDRLEISSPGSFLPKGNAQDYDLEGIPSVRRNQSICDLFSLIGFMEKTGSGFRKIRREYKNVDDSLKPTAFSNKAMFQITFYNLLFKDTPGLSSLKNLEEAKREANSIPFAEEIIAACRNGAKTPSELQKLTTYKSRSAFLHAVIKPLIDAAILLPTNPNKKANNQKYILADGGKQR